MTAAPARTPAHPASRRWLPVALIVLTLALVAAGLLLLVRTDHTRTSGPLADRAWVEQGTTNTVVHQVSTALNEVLSYDYAHPQVATQAASKWLAGDAPAQYQQLFNDLKKLAPNQKLTFVAKVVTAGVYSLRGNTAQLLVFLDQKSTRASDKQSSVSAAQIDITAVKHHGTWQITELHPL